MTKQELITKLSRIRDEIADEATFFALDQVIAEVERTPVIK